MKNICLYLACAFILGGSIVYAIESTSSINAAPALAFLLVGGLLGILSMVFNFVENKKK